jgi:hypothetical protein
MCLAWGGSVQESRERGGQLGVERREGSERACSGFTPSG